MDTNSTDKTLTIRGRITEHEIVKIIAKAGFSAVPTSTGGFWQDKPVWKRASLNTLNCLLGCSIGDFSTIIYLQAYKPHIPLWQVMSLAILMGLCSSVLLESVLLKYHEKLSWPTSIRMALGMSFLSMLGMELAMNLTDVFITGGKADFSSPLYWAAFGCALVAGFIAPLPYNYYKLKKYNKSCH